MPVKSMNDLFLHTLKDIYYAEKQIYKNLPKMAKSAESQNSNKPSKSIVTRPSIKLNG